MPDHDPFSHPPEIIDTSKGYETRDVQPQAVLVWVFSLISLMFVAGVITYGFWYFYVPSKEAKTTPYPISSIRVVPPEPKIQANPVEDIKVFRRNEAQELSSYSRDPVTGQLHIPVERAMEIVAQEGLPTRPTPGAPDPDEPNAPSYTEGQAPSKVSLPAAGAPATSGVGAMPTRPISSAPGAARGGSMGSGTSLPKMPIAPRSGAGSGTP